MKTLLSRSISSRTAVVAAALTLVASVMAARHESLDPAPAPVAAATAPSSGRPRTAEPIPNLDLSKLRRPKRFASTGDLFPPPERAASAGPAAAPKRALAAPPAAPPLPFQYLGKLVDGGKLTVFVIRGNEHYVVAPGEKVDDQYKVENVSEAAVTFTYLPLGTTQVLAVPPMN